MRAWCWGSPRWMDRWMEINLLPGWTCDQLLGMHSAQGILSDPSYHLLSPFLVHIIFLLISIYPNFHIIFNCLVVEKPSWKIWVEDTFWLAPKISRACQRGWAAMSRAQATRVSNESSAWNHLFGKAMKNHETPWNTNSSMQFWSARCMKLNSKE